MHVVATLPVGQGAARDDSQCIHLLSTSVTCSFFFSELDEDWLTEASGVQPYKLQHKY